MEGTSTTDLRIGPGHHRGSALPGQIGNFVVSGHRTAYGGPVNRLDELGPGDAIVIRAGGRQCRYRVYATEIVAPDEIGVTYPVPGRPHDRPDRALLTLATCHPEYSARGARRTHPPVSATDRCQVGVRRTYRRCHWSAAGVRTRLGALDQNIEPKAVTG